MDVVNLKAETQVEAFTKKLLEIEELSKGIDGWTVSSYKSEFKRGIMLLDQAAIHGYSSNPIASAVDPRFAFLYLQGFLITYIYVCIISICMYERKDEQVERMRNVLTDHPVGSWKGRIEQRMYALSACVYVV